MLVPEFENSKLQVGSGKTWIQAEYQTLGERPTFDNAPKFGTTPNREERATYPAPAIGTHGLHQLNDPNAWLSDSSKQYDLDIVAMHGLNGDIYRTWTKSGNYWLRDQLPKSLPGARIFSYGYPSNLMFSKSVAEIDDFARHLLFSLQEIVDEKRDILFICHSLGGIVFKQAMVFTYNENPGIWLRCKGVIFLGTPHRGSAAAEIAKTVASFVNKPSAYLGVKLFAGEIRTDLLADLAYDSPKLTSLSKTFEERAAVLMIYSFYESEKITGQVIVNRSSAILNVPHGKYAPLYADHRDICRFENAESDNYKKVLRAILEMADEVGKQKSQKPMSSAASGKSLDDLERACMEQLNAIDIATAHQAHLEVHVDGTLQWITTNNTYSAWVSAPKASLLWVTGPPGCGKTTLSSYVSECLSEEAMGSSIVCRFFCNARVKESRDPIIMLRSIIYQILIRRRRLLGLVRKARSLQGPQLFQQLSGLWELLLDLLRTEKKKKITIIIDSIDECDEPTQLMFINRITKYVQQAQAGDSPTKFFITSRPQTPVNFKLPSDEGLYPRLDLEDLREMIGQDVIKVIQHRLDSLVQRNSCSEDLRTRLELSLVSRAEKTFLWVSLALASLESKPFLSPADVRTLQTLPPTASMLYKQYLESIPKANHKIAGQLLRIIACSGRELSIGEINLLVKHSVGPSEELEHPVYTNGTIVRLLYPFVRISGDHLVLIHQSIMDFLLDLDTKGNDNLAKDFGVNIRRDGLFIAGACMRYLLSDTFSSDLFAYPEDDLEDEYDQGVESPVDGFSSSFDDWAVGVGDGLGFDDFENQLLSAAGTAGSEEHCKRISQEYDLYDYASKYWTGLFCQNNNFNEGEDELQDMAVMLLDYSNTQTTNWLRYYWALTDSANDARPETLSSLVLAGYFGHFTILQHLLKQRHDSGEVGEAIHWASRQGNSSCLKVLLNEYFDKVSDEPGICSLEGLSPLAAAAKCGHLKCAEVLLEQRIFDINAKDRSGQTALSLAVTHGHGDIVALLLKQQEIDPNLPDGSGYTPLFWTTACNSQSILSMLLKDKRVDPCCLDRSGRNPLSWAAEEGQAALAKQMIVDGRMDLNNRDSSGRTPLLLAVLNMHLPVVKLLIESKRADVSVRDKSGRNTISWAAERTDKYLIHYLIKKCPNEVDAADDQGWTPLAWSLEPPGYLNNALLLLQSGRVDINFRDITGRSPLSFAVGWGYVGIAETFLRFPGINPNCVDGEGNTPIFEAVRDNNVEMIKMLLSTERVDVNFRNKSGKTPLAVAAAAGKLDIVNLLLSVDGIDREGLVP
ncbi:hypothetical protein TWF718_002547 [Orbilia javanica]|uniref:NACHT domain-containing protein n=1 Tax=Orbilia javanica TaxID=47235 RepID=A0AAN8RBI7_9PEZI